MRTIFTFWSFAHFTWMERLCLSSWVAAGHPVDLYSYEEIPALPAGVTLKDASEIVDRRYVVRNEKKETYSVFGDLFRYEGLRRGLGIWCDADVLLLRDLDDLKGPILAWENDRTVCNAVFYLPPDEPFLRQMIEVATSPVPVPPQWPRGRRLRQRLRGLVGKQKPLARLSHTVIGPQALTWYVRKYRIPCLPREMFYPLPPEEGVALLPFIPGVRVEDYFLPETRALHLWNTLIRPLKRGPPPPGSFMARMCERYLDAPVPRLVHSRPASDLSCPEIDTRG